MVEDGPKQYIDSQGLLSDPNLIDTKANLKDKFSSLTQSRQPRPGPGSYSLPDTFRTIPKPIPQQCFGSNNARFHDSVFHKGVGNGREELGPGKYEHQEDIQKKQNHKRSGFVKNQEIVAFHKLRQLFPEKTSISTV